MDLKYLYVTAAYEICDILVKTFEFNNIVVLCQWHSFMVKLFQSYVFFFFPMNNFLYSWYIFLKDTAEPIQSIFFDYWTEDRLYRGMHDPIVAIHLKIIVKFLHSWIQYLFCRETRFLL